GNIYVAGHTDTLSPHDDWVILRLNNSGDSLWTAFYDSPLDGIDTPEFMAVDDSGYVYVCGDCGASSFDWEMNAVTMKYDSLGNRLWVHDYNGPQSMDDRIENFGLDNNGYPVVVGYSEIPDYGKEYLIIKLQPDGDTAWVRTMPTGNGTFDRLYGVAFDDDNNIYVAGGNSAGGNYDIAIIKYTPGGDTLWMRIYNGGPSHSDVPYGIGLDDSGYVYVGGYTDNATKDFLAIKYDSDGNFVWDFVYNGAGNAADNIRDAIVDSDGNVYMIGETTENSQRDILVTKTDNTGTLAWDFQYDAGGNANELVFNSKNLLNVDDDGNVYFGGATYYIAPGATNTNALTFKLCPDGSLDWYGRYGGPGLDIDHIKAVQLDFEGNCYVTGYSEGLNGNWDLFLLKYAADTTGAGCDYVVGDVNGSGSYNGLDITYGVAFFKGGLAPLCADCPPCNTWNYCGDVNASCSYNGLDITYGVAYFKGGPGPMPCVDCPPNG
ncbi:MAG: SBBP repeat-containing protein, partial [Candidatus Zixiibacteriota bacterium]